MGLIFEIFSLWAGVKPLGWAQVSNNNTWIEEKSNSNIPSQTRNFAIVNSYFMGGNWTFVLGGFEEKRVWNLIACNSITVSLLSACPDSLVLQDGKEMNVCVVKICNDRDKFLATVLVDGEYQEVGITSDCASMLSICFVKFEVCIFDRKVVEIVKTYSKWVKWDPDFEVFDEWEVWNFIICNLLIVGFYLKAQNKGGIDACQWMEVEEMPYSTILNSMINEFESQRMCVEIFKCFKNMSLLVPLCLRYFVDRNDLCASVLVGLFMQIEHVPGTHYFSAQFFAKLDDLASWKELMESESTGMILLHSLMVNKHWDSGESNIPIGVSVHECCGRHFPRLYSQLKFVFDRGKTWIIRIKVRYQKLDTSQTTTRPSQVSKQMLIPGLMIDIYTFQQKNCNWSIENDIWPSSILMQLLLSFSIRDSGLARFKQWNLEKKDLILNYCTKRVLMQIVVRPVLLVINFLEMKKGYATSNALMFATTILKSSTMVISWDPGKFNTLMTRVDYQCCLRNSLSSYGLLNLVFDRGKIRFKSILVLLMLVYDRG
jgi:hypothetical protein